MSEVRNLRDGVEGRPLGRLRLDLGTLRDLQSILDINAEVADGALDLGMTGQDLDGAQVAGCLVDDRHLGAPQGECSDDALGNHTPVAAGEDRPDTGPIES